LQYVQQKSAPPSSRCGAGILFDLFDYADVAANADAIVGALRSGQMPCDGAWAADQVATFQRWIDAGKPA
jgi:hypothetical protein